MTTANSALEIVAAEFERLNLGGVADELRSAAEGGATSSEMLGRIGRVLDRHSGLRRLLGEPARSAWDAVQADVDRAYPGTGIGGRLRRWGRSERVVAVKRRVAGWFFDEEKRELRPIAGGLMGLGLLAMGLVTLIACLDAMAGGRQYAGGWMPRTMGNRMPADIGAVVSLFLTFAGLGFVWIALIHAYPETMEKKWMKYAGAWVVLAMLGALVLLGLYVVAARLLR